jgi:hypothetical protein
MIVRPDDPDGRALLALTVRQPWAAQIAVGTKRCEYRDWSTDYRGDLLITASAALPPGVDPSLPRGCAICVVEVTGIREVDETDPPDVDYTFAWVLANPRPVKPVPTKGRLQLWEVSPELARQLGLVVELVK